MRALVVDDERRARQRLTRLLAAMPGVEVVGEAPHGLAALEAIPRVQPDAVFLDVQMPGLSGFEVLDTLPESQRPLVVFVTAHDEYALRAFDVSAVDFLVKPVMPDRLARALVRLRDRHAQQRMTDLVAHLRQSRPLERIVGKHRHEFHVIPVEAVEAFVAEQELVFAITSAGRFLVEKTLRELEAALDVHRFVRVHRSAIVNLTMLTVVQPIARGGATVRLRGGHAIEISRRYAQPLRDKLGW
jgi:two-component system LytT family response regulator